MKQKNYKILLDMDGVLTDFEKRYSELFKRTPKEARDNKEFNPDWHRFIREKNFEKLEWHPGAKELLTYIRSLNIPVEILSSSGGEKFHGEVTVQKIRWLKRHGISYKANIVSGRRKKKEYAKPNTILIDDTNDVIDDFNQAGGIGILHKDSGKTIEKLKKIFDKD